MSRNRRDDDREARLAEALRANLRRRKAQTRAQDAARDEGRATGPDGDPASGDDPAPPPPSERR